MIPITRPFLPPQEEYEQYLSGIWQRQWLTNMGLLASNLELTLKNHLDVSHLLYVTNGTVALELAIKSLELKGEVITTAFTFVATTSSIIWAGCTPVFVDIDPNSLNLDPAKIEEAINEHTVAILATHVYGNPCDVVAIQAIADRHNLKVIYDGAHAFGVVLHGQSVFNFGDVSTCSLHATKLYHSTEGGLVMTTDADLLRKLAFMRNFGFNGPEAFAELGINGKNSEFHAAMGLANFKYIDEIKEKRKTLSERYDENLCALNARRPTWHPDSENNHAYYALIFDSQKQMLDSIEYLKAHEIFTRRYFFPSLATSLPYMAYQPLMVTDDISSRILCLPLYPDLTLEEVDFISRLLLWLQDN
jgi:dTDP-4-amino-4,6-dideoxygalactose transaminase